MTEETNRSDKPAEDINEQMQVRLNKIETIKDAGEHPYRDRFDKEHTLGAVLEMDEGTTDVKTAGRVVAMRWFGKLAFGHIYDESGKLQFALQKNKLGDRFAQFKKTVDIGDFVGVEGEIITTKTGEKTIDVSSWTFLSKSLRPLPEKFHGMTDPELRLRRRYLDLITSPEVMNRFRERT